MIDECPQVFGVEEVDAVQVRDVHTASVGGLAVGAILLHMEAEEAHLIAINLLKHKQGLCTVGELVWKISLQNNRSVKNS